MPKNPAVFPERFLRSESFRTLFGEIMRLVEDAAQYMDGQGRLDVGLMGRDRQLAYAARSMRLTTQLMNMAAWAMLLRTVETGEKTFPEVAGEMEKFESGFHRKNDSSHPTHLLSEEMLGLLGRAERLRLRSVRLLVSFGLSGKEDRVGQLAEAFDDTG